jgi:hypothetical protein
VRLQKYQIRSYAELTGPENSQQTHVELLDALREGTSLEDIRVVSDARGEVLAAIRLHPVGPRQWMVDISGAKPGAHRMINHLFEEAALRADKLGRDLLTLVPNEWMDVPLAMALEAAGFRHFGRRMTWRASLEELPHPKLPRRLEWSLVSDSDAFKLFDRAAVGDPWAPRGRAWAQWLLSSEMVSEIWTGSLSGQDAACCCAQVLPDSGWGRIAYMGVFREVRGLGLGRLVHHFGLQRLRALGGRTWEGGTGEKNIPMRRILEGLHLGPPSILAEWRRPWAE